MGYLDSSGLSHFWSKVKTILSGKQDSLTMGDGLSLNGNTVNITDPVKGITQAEYGALTDAEKNSGLYVLTDAENQVGANSVTFIPSVSDSGVISWTNNGGLSNPDPVNIKGPQGETGPKGEDASDVYSTEEIVIGTWIDGKPIYSRTFTGVSPDQTSQWMQLPKVGDNIETVIDISGSVQQPTYEFWVSLPYICPVDANGMTTNFEVGLRGGTDGRIFLYNGVSFLCARPFTITCKYTKTTDPATIPQSTLLTSNIEASMSSASVSYAPASASSAKM